MTYKDDYTRDLLYTLLLNDESYDVHSFERFPQFHATSNPAHAIHAQFDSSVEGYASGKDNALVITNVCRDSSVLITAINVRGTDDISFRFAPVVLAPGESKSVKFDGEFSEISLSNFEICISYAIGNYTPIGQRIFDFVLMNGEAAEFDSENPYVADEYENGMDEIIGEDTVDILEKYGVKTIASIIYETVMKIYDFIVAIIGFFA
jgi:hypothetical protein